MKKQIPLSAVLAIGLVIVLASAYMLLVRPQGAKGGELDVELAALQDQLVAARTPAAPATPAGPEIKIADLFRLSKALPEKDDMPGIILELNAIASASGVTFLAIQPQAPLAGASFYALPIMLTFDGNYYDLSDFLYRLRNLVTVKDGTLDADGRLYTLDALDLHESVKGFPQIEALLTITAYAFGQPPAIPGAPPAPAPVPATTSAATTTGATDTAATTTETAPAGEDGEAAGGTG
jgi:type IV pilus assembly protein PilO